MPADCSAKELSTPSTSRNTTREDFGFVHRAARWAGIYNIFVYSILFTNIQIDINRTCLIEAAALCSCAMLCWVHALYFMLKQLNDPGMPVVIVPEPISTQNKQLAKWVAHEVHVPAATTTQATASFFVHDPLLGDALVWSCLFWEAVSDEGLVATVQLWDLWELQPAKLRDVHPQPWNL